MNVEGIAIHGADRKFILRAIGLGTWMFWMMGSLTVLGFLVGIAGGVWAWREARVSASQIERYVVVLSSDSQVVGTSALRNAGSLPDAVYLDFARRWIRFLRSRPADATVGKLQATEVIQATDGKLYAQLRDSTDAANAIARSNAIDVLAINVNLLEPVADNSASLAVHWQEQIRTPNARPAVWSATLRVVYVPNAVTNEFGRNPLGLYAISFQPTLEN